MCDSREFCRSSRDSTIGINFDALGDIEHFEHVSGDLFDLFKSGENSDVVFVINGSRFEAHRVILAARCNYFKVLLFGDMREARSGAEIPIVDTTPDAFHALLEYIYSGRICLADVKEQIILDLLGLANKYDFAPLQTSIMAFLRATLNVNNVCLVYNVASFYQLKDLCYACSTFVDSHASEVMKSDGFLSLSLSALTELCNRDSFFAAEIDIYRGIVRWVTHNEVDREVSRTLLKVVRLQLIPMELLLSEIRNSKLFDPDSILDAITLSTTKKTIELGQRGLLIPEENVATPQHDAVTVEGQVKHALLNGDTENYNGEQGYTTHTIMKDSSKGITVQLGQPFVLNCIRMLLWDRDNRSYSYYIQVSLDQRHWVTIVVRSDHLCRSWQELFFESKVVRYVRVVGVHNSMNRSFHLVSFACLYTSKPFTLANRDIIVPEENVASITASATVLDGVSRSRNALLNGSTRDYDWDSGYTCHQLGSGCIMVQLTQPYMVSSMRMLLWDKDDRTYGYYIEVSIDQETWKRVADRSNDSCQSWQIVEFEQQPVTFIKIVGTKNTANEVFHVVHFECPASPDAITRDSVISSSEKQPQLPDCD